MPLKIGTPIHCLELNSKSKLTGTLLVTEDTMHVNFVGYDEYFFIRPESPVFLKTESGDIVSLHSNISAGTGSTSRLIDQKEQSYEVIHHQGIVSNIVVVGNNRWEEADKIKRAQFSVGRIDHLLRHDKKMQAISDTRHPTEENLSLFRDVANGITVSAGYGVSYRDSLLSPTSVWQAFEIEFHEAVDIHEYIKHVSNYVFFLSLLVGVSLVPKDIYIDRLSLDEMEKNIETHSYLGKHRVHYVWPEGKIEEGDTNGFGSPVHAYNDDELASLRAVLIFWMNRSEQWQKPYQLMMASFSFRHVISSERLLNACRWLEEIPEGKPQNELSKNDIAAISAAASEKAATLGHSEEIQKRIGNAIGMIRKETSKERFSRLIKTVRLKFGEKILPSNAIEHLTRAVPFRGRAAHGHFEPKNDGEHRAFYKSTCAMEALCLLLTVRDLPISENGKERISSHPLVVAYLRAYE